MKKAFFAVVATLMLALSGVAAAADPNLIAGTDGALVRGLGVAVGVAPADYGTTLTKVLYVGSTGWQNVQDDAAGSKYQKIKAQLIAVGGVEVGSTGWVFVPGRALEVGCNSGTSYVSFPNTNVSQNISDSCAYRDKVRALAP